MTNSCDITEVQTHLQCSTVHDEIVSDELADPILSLSGRCCVDLREWVVHFNKCIEV